MPQVAGHGEKITRKAEQVIAALLQYPTIPEAAKATGVSERTIYTWLRDDDFRDQYRLAKAEIVYQALGNLQKITGEAVEVLRDIMNDGSARSSSRISAAKTILETALKVLELEDLETRIEALEAELERKKDNKR